MSSRIRLPEQPQPLLPQLLKASTVSSCRRAGLGVHCASDDLRRCRYHQSDAAGHRASSTAHAKF
eukprot:1583860-Alexandrium_andersonii.AAC.1